MRLKLDALENSLADKKALSSELSDRYSEAQRDIQRKQEEILSLQVSVESLNSTLVQRDREAKDKDEAIAKLLHQIGELEGSMQEVRREGEVTCGETVKALEAARAKAVEGLERRLQEQATLLAQEEARRKVVEGERDHLQSLSEKASLSARGLEEYKSRAQKALKQVQAVDGGAAWHSMLSHRAV